MKKLKKEIVIRYLKEKRCMAIGELTAEMILKQVKAILDSPIKIAGRNNKTGRRTHNTVRIGEFLTFC